MLPYFVSIWNHNKYFLMLLFRGVQKDNSCQECGESENLMECETCNYAYHAKCLLPPLKAPPPDNWRCPECVCFLCLLLLLFKPATDDMLRWWLRTKFPMFAGEPTDWYWQDSGLRHATYCCRWCLKAGYKPDFRETISCEVEGTIVSTLHMVIYNWFQLIAMYRV